ncbi:hypothetical protein C2869_09335 [Saccharobesus litoralis]|uniref:Uncharacterized protein n=1 Tax=Saccharobesus litoralis TaxID=2172099 RepID=A0A2S0VRB4_9ALTE|nr:hypothetical protein [Saccharobesus litoralis]AWB66620.1 hypothetical protein C2869_09335 [Saccharobesus litoralis]
MKIKGLALLLFNEVACLVTRDLWQKALSNRKQIKLNNCNTFILIFLSIALIFPNVSYAEAPSLTIEEFGGNGSGNYTVSWPTPNNYWELYERKNGGDWVFIHSVVYQNNVIAFAKLFIERFGKVMTFLPR